MALGTIVEEKRKTPLGMKRLGEESSKLDAQRRKQRRENQV